jgi:hypothetical protein
MSHPDRMNVNVNASMMYRDPSAARRANRNASRQVLPIVIKRFDLNRQARIRALVTQIRAHKGKTNTTPGNITFRSKALNASNAPILSKIDDLLKLILNPLQRVHKFPPIQSARILLRYIPNDIRSYASLQTLHRNMMNNPAEGRGFLQFIYYIDTPHVVGQGNAPETERGQLLLNPMAGSRLVPGNTTVITPTKGQVVYFSPETALHEVVQPTGNNIGNVTRNMVIGIISTSSGSGNVNYGNAGKQIRPFQNARGEPTNATRSYANVVRTIANVARPAGAPHPGANNLTRMLGRMNIGPDKRKRTATATPSKRRKLNTATTARRRPATASTVRRRPKTLRRT